MNEVEKLYNLAGVEPTHYDACKIADAYWLNEELANEYGTFDNYMKLNCKYHYQECTDECRHAYDRDTYPPFTAEKQLELIKWLAKKNYGYQSNSLLINVYDGITYLQAGISCGEDLIYDTYSSDGDTLEEAIAKILRFMWNKLTDAERTQIKNILAEVRE